MKGFKKLTAVLLATSMAMLPQSVLAKELFTVGNACGVIENVYCHYIPWVYLN